jgi:polysaccharide pyruvyl transferase WcaK-like protein
LPTALLAGAFGQGNLGDEALLQAFATALPDWRMVATRSDRCAHAPWGRHSDVVEFEGVPSNRPLAVAGQAIRADAVIVGGGTVFKMLDGSTGRHRHSLLANASALVGSASLLGRPVAMVGVGAGRIEGPAATVLTKFLVRHSDLLILRDEESAETLSATGATGPFRVGADPAWTLLAPPEAAGPSRAPRVLVVPSREAAGRIGGRGRLLRLLAGTIERLRANGVEVALQAWQRDANGIDDDEAMVDVLRGQLDASVEVVAAPRSLPDAVESIRAFGTVLCLRFHSLVATAAAGTPAVALAHEPKLAGLARRLGQHAVPPTVSPEQLTEATLESIDAPGPAPAIVKEEIDRAEEGFRLLRVFLAGGTDESDRLGALPLVSWPT